MITILETSTFTNPIDGRITLNAKLAVTNNGTTYLLVCGGIPADTPDVQVFLNAEESQLLLDAKARGAIITAQQITIWQWATQHTANKKTFAAVLFTLDNGILTIPDTTLASYRTVLTNALNAAATLPAAFLTQFANERTAQGLTMAVSAMTAAQCAAFENLMRSWLLARISMALIADSVKAWLLNGGQS